MNRIQKIFQKKKPFIGFVVGGDGGIDYCVECCLKLIEGGIDILEIGFPFSDPIADGPAIQRASERALKQGTTSKYLLEIAKRIREQSDIPLILFSYFNPLFKKGALFLNELKAAGYDAVLIVDLPPPINDYSHSYYQDLKHAGLHPIFLVAPSTDDGRIAEIAKIAEGFIYYACQKGTTGIRQTLPQDYAMQIARIRQHTNTPIAAGFGIADFASAAAALEEADGFVVGSAFVNLMEKQSAPTTCKLLAETIDPRKKINP